jgi:hypothetical protein
LCGSSTSSSVIEIDEFPSSQSVWFSTTDMRGKQTQIPV